MNRGTGPWAAFDALLSIKHATSSAWWVVKVYFDKRVGGINDDNNMITTRICVLLPLPLSTSLLPMICMAATVVLKQKGT